MMSQFTRAVRPILASLLLVSAGTVLGETLSPITARQAQKAIELQQQEKWPEALAVLESARAPTVFDQAYVNRLLGVAYWHNDMALKAINALTAAVDAGQLDADAQRASERMLADILMTQSRYQEALARYHPLTKQAPEPVSDLAEIWLRIAQAHYQLKAFTPALEAINRYLATKPATVAALSLKLGAQLQLNQWQGSVATLKQLIGLEPANRTWWIQLVGSYQRLDDRAGMLNTLILAERNGIALTSSEKQMLAQLYQQQGVPEKGAAILHSLNQGDASLTRLTAEASYWQQAKEWDKAITAWERAAQMSPQYYWVAAQLALQHGQWQKALELLDKVDDAEKAADVELSRAYAYDKLSEFDKALLHAKRAHELKPSEQSQSWIQYLNQKRK